MESENEKTPYMTVENFMADVPDSATREKLYDLLGDDPMFSPENLAKAQEAIDQMKKELTGVSTNDSGKMGK